MRLLRAAVLAAVARERPGEAEPLALARSHFGCTRDAAADLLHSAEARSLPRALVFWLFCHQCVPPKLLVLWGCCVLGRAWVVHHEMPM